MLDLTISIQGRAWQPKRRVFTQLAQMCVSATLEAEKLSERHVTLACVLCGDEFMQGLNRSYRYKDTPTNVLAFPNLTEAEIKAALHWKQPLMLGDLIISGETVQREAAEQKKEASHHLAHLLVHGTLHLLGYDHRQGRDANRMEAKEIRILKALGVANPYL